MTQQRCRAKVRLEALCLIACLVATQAGAQATGNGLPTAREIWQHLPPLPGLRSEPAPTPRPLASRAPEPAPPAAAPRPRATSSAAPPHASDATVAVSSRTLAEARVVVHFSQPGGYERSEELVRLLRAVGTAEVETRPVRYPVDQQSIRYFHESDRDVSGIIGDLIGGGGRATVFDFTHFRPSPRNGTVEIWLP